VFKKFKNIEDLLFIILWTVVLAITIVVLFIVPSADAQNSNEQICLGGVHVELQNNVYEVTVTAPEGKLISKYCAKSSSIQNECGPIYTTFTQPVKTVTISYDHDLSTCDAKALSHYTITYTTEVPPSTTSSLPQTTIPSTTSSLSPTTSTSTTTLPTTTTVAPTTTLPSQVLSAGAARPILGNPNFTG